MSEMPVPFPRLLAIHSARQTDQEGCLSLTLSALAPDGTLFEHFEFRYVPSDPFGLTPIVKRELAEPTLIDGQYFIEPYAPPG